MATSGLRVCVGGMRTAFGKRGRLCPLAGQLEGPAGAPWRWPRQPRPATSHLGKVQEHCSESRRVHGPPMRAARRMRAAHRRGDAATPVVERSPIAPPVGCSSASSSGIVAMWLVRAPSGSISPTRRTSSSSARSSAGSMRQAWQRSSRRAISRRHWASCASTRSPTRSSAGTAGLAWPARRRPWRAVRRRCSPSRAASGIRQAVSHGSNDLAAVAKLRGIHSTVLHDYEGAAGMHRINFRLADKVMVPEVIPFADAALASG